MDGFIVRRGRGGSGGSSEQVEGYEKVFDGDVDLLKEIPQDNQVFYEVRVSPDESKYNGDMAIVKVKIACPTLNGYDTYGYHTFVLKPSDENIEYPDSTEVYCGNFNTIYIFIRGSRDNCTKMLVQSPDYPIEMTVVHSIIYRKKMFGGASGVDISDATALPENVLKDMVFYGKNGRGIGTYEKPASAIEQINQRIADGPYSIDPNGGGETIIVDFPENTEGLILSVTLEQTETWLLYAPFYSESTRHTLQYHDSQMGITHMVGTISQRDATGKNQLVVNVYAIRDDGYDYYVDTRPYVEALYRVIEISPTAISSFEDYGQAYSKKYTFTENTIITKSNGTHTWNVDFSDIGVPICEHWIMDIQIRAEVNGTTTYYDANIISTNNDVREHVALYFEYTKSGCGMSVTRKNSICTFTIEGASDDTELLSILINIKYGW